MSRQHSDLEIPFFELPAHRRRAVLSLAPLIDVTFILLIFFMVVTQFTRLVPVDIELGQVTPASLLPKVTGETGQRERISLALHADGTMNLDGETISSLEDLRPALHSKGGVFAPSSADIKNEKQNKPLLLIEPAGDVELQLLIDVMAIVKAFPNFSVKIVSQDNGKGQK